ncbi:MAG: hypothetical protein SynsKO_26140 [Synoicihabitans sp.]
MPTPLNFHDIGRLPAPGDNVAIAVKQLEPGTQIALPDGICTISHTVMEGHRFAVRPIAPTEALLSWELPFGNALSAIHPGDYVCNASILEALKIRQPSLVLPTAANFQNCLDAFSFDPAKLAPPAALTPPSAPRTFAGFRRPGKRGVGTRNMIVVLGTSSRTASFVRQLTARLQNEADSIPDLDGIVAIAHTEGGDTNEPNNAPEVLRALAGFMVHPNVGAVLAVDEGDESITNARLEQFMRKSGYPLEDAVHEFLSTHIGLANALQVGEEIVRGWLPSVAAHERTAEPLSELKIALQCGGSDAFSGVSGNPLAGAMVHEIVRHGGVGVLCETDEIVGAEDHLMRNIRSQGVAETLLACIARFKERMRWHGVTPESNPSAGNKFRGLYNIVLKSLGAVQKKDPRTPLDHVIDYAVPLTKPGFYFMDSPGNDLEAIGGQVGSGCNLVLFVTGNGSVTNFPFVPTLKITTTTRRHRLLEREMDINAGRYLDGENFEALTAESLDLLIETASGKSSKGEKAGHYQSSLWRNWQQKDDQNVAAILSRPEPSGVPLPVRFSTAAPQKLPAVSTERVGLVLPTSMCSSQIARMAAARMNASDLPARRGLSRFVALPHSEGCGFGGETMYQTLCRTYRGYATHPNVGKALLLEHGCEKIPNDAMRHHFETTGLSLDRFGWASVQLDGGIDRTIDKIEAWFGDSSGTEQPLAKPTHDRDDFDGLVLGLLSEGAFSSTTVDDLVTVVGKVLSSGGTILIPESDPLLARAEFTRAVLAEVAPTATLANGAAATQSGLHVVQTESDHWVENTTSLGAGGAHLLIGMVGEAPRPGHPLVPQLQVAEALIWGNRARTELDLVLEAHSEGAGAAALLERVKATLAGRYTPRTTDNGWVDFQFARGPLGVSA